jgi:hypothetical protein
MKKTREQYLQQATTQLRKWYATLGFDLPEIQASVGFPSTRATSTRNQRVGECWHGDHQGGTPHIFISPVIDTGPRALDILVHEHLHAFLPAGAGHKGPFKQAMKAVGLEGKPTATIAGPELTERLEKLDAKLGGYPHVVLTPGSNRKKQTTRLIKVECVEDDYIVRVSRKPLDAYGPPICPVCHETMQEA